ncbi:MAG: helix-turn-helix domain-containing protein [Bacteroidales bacterium]|nr:helix-turn-helix domain-containing protein [Bacteroidales bacterium]
MEKTQIELYLARIEKLLLVTGKEVLTSEEAAIYMGISRDHLQHLASSRDLPHYRKGNRNYYRKSEIDRWLLEERVDSRSEIEAIAATYVTTGKMPKTARR